MSTFNDATDGGDKLGRNWQSKLRLLDAIDSMRIPIEDAPKAPAAATVDETALLREKLHTYEQTCALLEREVHVLEQQTLAALAEAGRLRRELERNEVESRMDGNFATHIEKNSLRRIIADSENERRLLLDALENSEAELARMVKTLDVVVRKLQVA